MSSSINNEVYKIKRKYCASEKNSTSNLFAEVEKEATTANNNNNNSTPKGANKFHITKIQERIKFTQKYRIKWACDPNSGLTYSLNEIRKLNLIDRERSRFRLPSTGESIDLDQAIRAGIVYAELIDEFLETFNQSFEFIQTDHLILSTKVTKKISLFKYWFALEFDKCYFLIYIQTALILFHGILFFFFLCRVLVVISWNYKQTKETG
jgi:hypothetical protein